MTGFIAQLNNNNNNNNNNNICQYDNQAREDGSRGNS
jgi:hypothetical protein